MFLNVRNRNIITSCSWFVALFTLIANVLDNLDSIPVLNHMVRMYIFIFFHHRRHENTRKPTLLNK